MSCHCLSFFVWTCFALETDSDSQKQKEADKYRQKQTEARQRQTEMNRDRQRQTRQTETDRNIQRPTETDRQPRGYSERWTKNSRLCHMRLLGDARFQETLLGSCLLLALVACVSSSCLLVGPLYLALFFENLDSVFCFGLSARASYVCSCLPI